MPQLIVIDRAGNQQVLECEPGLSAMEVVRDAGIDGLAALCGGVCSCATCHVYVDAPVPDALPQISNDEDDLLDSSRHRRENSRLSCQIRMQESLSGLRITIADED